MPPPYAHKPRSCEGCHTPIPLPRNTRTKRCPPCQKIYGRSRKVSQGALRYVKLKADGLSGEGIGEEFESVAVLDRRIAEVRSRIAWFEAAANGNILPRMETW